MKLLLFLLMPTAFGCVPPVISTEYNFQFNVTQISGSLGSYIRVLCAADPDTDVTSYVWQKNGENIEEPSLLSSFLTIRDLSVEDGGGYRCEVTTTGCGTGHSPEISINTPPDNVVISGPVSVTVGQSFTLTCSANGWPPPNYAWSFNGAPLLEVSGSVYSVSSADMSHAGEYTCVAQNSRGLVRTSATLTVSAASAQVLTSTPVLPPPKLTSEGPAPLPTSTSRDTSVGGIDKKTSSGLLPVSTAADMQQSKPEALETRSQRQSATLSVTSTPAPPTATDGGSAKPSTSAPAAPFVVLLALAIALLLALVGIIITIFVLVVWTMKTSPSRGKRNHKRLVEEGERAEEGGGGELEMQEGDPGNQSSEPDKSPTSCVNIAFGQDSSQQDDEDEEEEEEEEGDDDVKMLISGGRSEGALLKVSPQRYQQQPSTLEPGSKKWPRPSSSSAVPHSVSMDIPQGDRGAAGPARSVGVPASRSMGEPGGLRASRLTPPPDRHRVGRQKKTAKSGGEKTPKSGKLQMENVCDSEKLQLLTAMEGSVEMMEEQTQKSNATVLTALSMEESREPGETVEEEERLRESEEEGKKLEGEPGKEEKKMTMTEERKSGELREQETVMFGEDGEEVEAGKVERVGYPLLEKIEVSELQQAGERERQVDRQEGREDAVEISFIGEVEEREIEEERGGETKVAVVIREKIGEATVTFEQEGDTGDLWGEGSGAVLSSALLSSGDEEGGGGEGGERDGEWDKEGEGGGGGEGEKEGEWDKGEEGREQKEVEREVVMAPEERELVPEDVGKEASTEEATQNQDVEKNPDIHRMTVFVEKARKMGRTSLIAELDRSHPLTVEETQELVEEALSGAKGSRLTVEYKTVPHNSVQSLPLSTEEKHKNRYRNVLPNPHSAVRLSDTGVAGSQYINANYIGGYGDKEGQYIATQGPINNTLADFWRMVWEKNVTIIVMTTSLVENGSQKCVKYWPAADNVDTVVYGNMVVRNNYEEVTDSYTTSYLSIYPQSPDGKDMGEERDIYHFWYTAWCDFGVPRETGSILGLREAVDAFRGPSSGPVLVHCSAGLGRSGTFMAIDMGIQQYEAEGVIDPLKYMCEMRQDRGGIIQTADQYIYIHRALRDYMTA